MRPPGLNEASYTTFAIMDELIRTLVEKDLFSPADAIGVLSRTLENLDRGRATTVHAIPVIEEMIREYSKQTR